MRDGRIATIDGLRGIAILLVVWFHVWQICWQSAVIPLVNVSLQPFPETGFLGVALFFFISGFVLLLPYAEAARLGRRPPPLRHFFLRRFFKIVPSYVLCIVVLLALGVESYPSFSDAVRDVAFHLLFIHDWFAVTNGTIDGVMWSLGAEVQFYLIFPFIAAAFVRRPIAATIAMFAIANAWRIWCMASNHYFLAQRMQQLPAYFDFFAAGMLAAALSAVVAQRPALTRRRGLFTALALAGFAVMFIVTRGYFDQRYDAGWPYLQDLELRSLLALGYAAAGLGSLFAVRAFQRALGNPALLFLAAISYNLYLWHQPLAKLLMAHHVPPFRGADPHLDDAWRLAFAFVAVAAAVAVSSAITYGFERPILRWSKRWERGGGPEPRAAAAQAGIDAPTIG
jgi:peptidoglycan/LPS O-acetylase OafA/YrhL